MVFNPRMARNIRLQVGEGGTAKMFQREVNNVAFVPTTPTASWAGGTPDAVFTDIGPETWVANVTVGQDWTEDTSFVNYLLENAGTVAVVTYWPQPGGPGFEVNATLVSPQIGGATGAFNESGLSLPCDRPVIVEPYVEPVEG